MSEGENNNWYDSFPESVQQWDEVQNSSGPEQFWQRITSHRQHIGQSIRIPSDEASADDMNAFYDKLQKRVPNLMPVPDIDDPDGIKAVLTKLGMPENADSYGEIEGDQYKFAEGQLDKLKGLALNAGLTKSQFQKLAEQVGTTTAEELNAAEDFKTQTEAEIKETWGMAADERLKETTSFLKQSNAPENLINAMSNTDLDAATVMWLHSLAAGIGETQEGGNHPDNAPNNAALTPFEAQERIDEMLSNRQHPYHRGDKRARARMHELMAMANVV